MSFLPNAVNVIHAHIDFACRLIGEIGIDDTLVESELTTVRGNAEHIIHGRVNLTGVNGCGSLGKLLHHRLLDFCRLCNFVVVDRCRGQQVELISGFDVCRFFEQVHQFGQIKELRKAGSCTVSRALRCKLNGCRGFSESRSPTIEVCQAFVADGVMLQVTHHRVQLRHGVADGRSRCEYNAPAVGQFVDVAAF